MEMSTHHLSEMQKRAESYGKFIENMKFKIETADEAEKSQGKMPIIILNYQRSTRIARNFKLNTELQKQIDKISEPQNWFVLTEDWCGDSAQNLPYIIGFAASNPNIKVKILERDSNLEIMDQYLTNGKRSIPKLIAFDEAGMELFQWGPRPETAQNLFDNLKTQGTDQKEISRQLHTWYAKNRGKFLTDEFIRILENIG